MMPKKVVMFSGIPFEKIYAAKDMIDLTDRQREYLDRVHRGYRRETAEKSQGNLDWQMEQNILKKYWRWYGGRSGGEVARA